MYTITHTDSAVADPMGKVAELISRTCFHVFLYLFYFPRFPAFFLFHLRIEYVTDMVIP